MYTQIAVQTSKVLFFVLKAMFCDESSHVQLMTYELLNQGIAWHFKFPQLLISELKCAIGDLNNV